MTGYQTPFIFLAEDDLDDQELLIEAFTTHSSSLTIETATNGKKLLCFLEGLPDSFLPCLIVLDFNLPEIDGAQILKLLSENNRFIKIPKVVWSTSTSPVYKEKCLELGAHAYYVKPTDISSIHILAKEMLEFCDEDFS